MRPRVDLPLINQSLGQLYNSTYFEKRLHEFIGRLRTAIDHVLDNPKKYDPAVEAQFSQVVLLVQSYLAGSTNNEIPYEVVHCLRDALRRWTVVDAPIVTHITEAHDFHFVPIDPWSFITKTIGGFDAQGYHLSLVMIGVPRIYAHKPLFCIPLYHELGHFVDISYQISEISALQWPHRVSPVGAKELSYRREYFADLFAASFVGRSSVSALEAIAPGDGDSDTHPSTRARAEVVDAFLNGVQHSIVDILQNALAARGLPKLSKIYDEVDVAASFDDLRTFVPSRIEQVHGMFDSAWRYLFEAIDGNRNPWNLAAVRHSDIESATNDLLEKSIRNFSIRAAWDDAASAN